MVSCYNLCMVSGKDFNKSGQVFCRRLHGAPGQSKLGVLLFILLVVCGAFVGEQVIPFYYYYHELLGLMENQAAKASVFRDTDIRKVLMKKIKQLEIPIDEADDLKINRFNDKIVIDLEYEEILYIDLGDERVYDLHVFRFNPHVEREY